jgi:hypothetical protein
VVDKAEKEENSNRVVSLSPKDISLPVDIASRTPQFWLLSTTFGLIATGGLGVLAVAKPMMSEVFSTAMPDIATGAFASSYVMMLAMGNLGGRLFWASTSDAVGRRPTFHAFNLIAAPLFVLLPMTVAGAIDQHSASMLYAFVLSTVTTVSIMGGTYACLPAYEADLFGPKNVGTIHGRNLLASSAAALGGPSLFLYLRHRAYDSAVTDVTSKCDPQSFLQATSRPLEDARLLLESKTLSLGEFASIANVPDPSPFLYDSSMYAIAGLASLAFLTHAAITPVHAKYFQEALDREKKAAAAAAHK